MQTRASISTQAILEIALERLRDDIIRRSEAEGQRASGRTYESISVQNVTPKHGELWGPTHIGVLEDGRKPGKIPYDFATIIMEWATYKGINIPDPVQFEKWANAVAWSIRNSGTLLYKSGQKVDIFKTAVADFEKYIIEQVKQYYTAAVANAIRTAWKK